MQLENLGWQLALIQVVDVRGAKRSPKDGPGMTTKRVQEKVVYDLGEHSCRSLVLALLAPRSCRQDGSFKLTIAATPRAMYEVVKAMTAIVDGGEKSGDTSRVLAAIQYDVVGGRKKPVGA